MTLIGFRPTAAPTARAALLAIASTTDSRRRPPRGEGGALPAPNMPLTVPEKLGELSRQISELSQKAIVDFEEIARLRELIDTIVFESYGLDDQDISTL